VDVDVTYDTAGCTDEKDALAVGAAVRFSNLDTCDGGLNPNGSSLVSATGPVVAVVNQIVDGKLEQTYNGFGPADANDVLYTPIALHAFYGFNSAFQVQNVSGAAMDVCATYSDGLFQCVTGVGDGDAATFLQGDESHVANWTGSAMITNTTGGDMVGIVNQQSNKSAASFNMFAGGATSWALPSLLYDYYGGYNSAFQVQNISSGAVDIDVTYSDGVTASADAVAAGGVATFIQNDETTHTNATAFSAVVEATGDIVIVVNQDVLSPGAFDYQYSYNAVPTQ
jgi:hypothetical protein